MKLTDNKLGKNFMEGTFNIKVVDAATGEILDEEETKNVIVLDAREAITRAISAPSNDSTIKVMKLGEDIGERMSGTPNVTFANDNPDTITRDSGSWVSDGFQAGDKITVRDTTFNDGEYTLDNVTASVLTVSGSDFLTAEVTSGGYITTGTQDAPALPLNIYDETTMEEIYTVPDTLTVGFPDTQNVNFSVTIIGSDLMSYYPSDSAKIFTSAELLVGNGNVFAYKRFTKKSISALVNIVVSWTVGFA